MRQTLSLSDDWSDVNRLDSGLVRCRRGTSPNSKGNANLFRKLVGGQ